MGRDLGQVQSRRQLFAGALRYVTLGLFAAGARSVAAKRRRLLREGKCINGGICSGCKVFEQCGLPQALSAREAFVRNQ